MSDLPHPPAARATLTDAQIGARADQIVKDHSKAVPSATDAVRAVVLATLVDQARGG